MPKATARKTSPAETITPSDAARRLLDVAALVDPGAAFNDGASEAELSALEHELGFALDEGLRALLSLANGCVVSQLYGEGFMSTTQILKQWRFFDDPRPLLPFADNNGVIAYVVREKGERFGVVGEWDHDGDQWGEFDRPKATSFGEFLAREEKRLRGLLPKNFPMIEGLWKKGTPEISPDALARLEKSLLKSLATGAEIDTALGLLDRAPLVQLRLVELLLERSARAFFAFDSHVTLLAKLADRIEIAIVLRALAERDEAPAEYTLLRDWSKAMDAMFVALLARDEQRVREASHGFAPSVRGGFKLVLRRLNLSSEPIDDELRDRVAFEGSWAVPYEMTIIDGGQVMTIRRTEGTTFYDFSLAFYFDSFDDYARRVVRQVLAAPPNKRFDDWIIAPAARVCEPSDFMAVVARLPLWEGRIRGSVVYDAMRSPVFPHTKRSPNYFVEAAARTTDEILRSEMLWVAYRVAVDSAEPLPQKDHLLRDPILFYGTLPEFYQPSVRAMAERAGAWASIELGSS